MNSYSLFDVAGEGDDEMLAPVVATSRPSQAPPEV
jgi:hypothetical protein